MVHSQFQTLLEGLQYRGREGQWSWILHRVTGLGVFLFLALHIFDIFLLAFGPGGPFDALLFIYHQPWARILHIFLFFGVLFHAFNGIRIIILDFWPALWKYQKEAVWITVIIFLAVFLPSTALILIEVFGEH